MTAILLIIAHVSAYGSSAASAGIVSVKVDAFARRFNINHEVPPEAPNEVRVQCAWSPAGRGDWRAARVVPFVSETALELATDVERGRWQQEGCVTERNAAGLVRTVVFDPYPEAQVDGKVDVDFRIRIETVTGDQIGESVTRLQADNSDVVYIEDWTGVFQKDAIAAEPQPNEAKWVVRESEAGPGASRGNSLHGNAGLDVALPQLSYPLDLRGPYAIFVQGGGILLRLTGDEATQQVSSRNGMETLWRWTRMDRQHLVLKQMHGYQGWRGSEIDYVKFVPLSQELFEELESHYDGPRDKFIAGYWESYSWAFHAFVRETLDHRAVLTAYKDARFSLVDSQVGRFGSKVEYETRIADQLLFNTQGDARADETIPVTDGVGRMQQFTNALDATIRYTQEMGLRSHANFGVSCAYVGSPLEGAFSKAHPDWLVGSQLRFEVPEVRAYALSLIREALEIGAPGISIDFMRYPQAFDDAAVSSLFLKELRALADDFAAKRDAPVPVLVQFPGTGVHPADQFERGATDDFDYATWVREGWVDFLCPSNDDERHLHLDVAPYLEAVKGTSCKVLPNVTAAGLRRPGPYLWRIKQLYDAGVDGVYIYQSDQMATGSPMDRRCARLLASSEDVRAYWERDAKLRPRRSKGIYITSPSRPNRGWRGRERVRIWLEGVPMGEVEVHLNGELVNRYSGPPYLLGTEERTSDSVIPPNQESELLVRAKDGDGWLEQRFVLQGERKPAQ